MINKTSCADYILSCSAFTGTACRPRWVLFCVWFDRCAVCLIFFLGRMPGQLRRFKTGRLFNNTATILSKQLPKTCTQITATSSVDLATKISGLQLRRSGSGGISATFLKKGSLLFFKDIADIYTTRHFHHLCDRTRNAAAARFFRPKADASVPPSLSDSKTYLAVRLSG